MIIDSAAAARRPAAERISDWLGGQRVFISSAMGDTSETRRVAAHVIEDEGARAVWFEEFGRDADAEEAYLSEVDASTIYVALLNELYGRQLESGWSATETEYLRARERGKRVAVFTAANAPAREGHLNRFIERLRVFITTENYDSDEDLALRLRRRLHDLAAEAISPWVKLADYVFRADEIDDAGDSVSIRAQLNDEIGHALEQLRDRPQSGGEMRLTYGGRVVDGRITGVRRVTRATGTSQTTIELGQVQAPRTSWSRPGTSGYSADDLVEFGLRRLFFGEPLPESLGMLGGALIASGINVDDPRGVPAGLRECFDLPSEIAEAVTRLVITEALVGEGNAGRVTSFALGPRDRDCRRIAIEWEEPRVYSNQEPSRRRIEGDWKPALR